MKTVQQKYEIRKVGFTVSFENLLLDAVDEGFSVLGESVKKSLYHYLERYGIRIEEIPTKIDYFVKALDEVLGSSSKLLLIQIMKNLHKKVGVIIKLSGQASLDFIKYAKAKRRGYLAQNWLLRVDCQFKPTFQF